jgi:hypothetical protein
MQETSSVNSRQATQDTVSNPERLLQWQWDILDSVRQRAAAEERHRKANPICCSASAVDGDDIRVRRLKHNLSFGKISTRVITELGFGDLLDRYLPAQLRIERQENLGVHALTDTDLVSLFVLNFCDNLHVQLTPRAEAAANIASRV